MRFFCTWYTQRDIRYTQNFLILLSRVRKEIFSVIIWEPIISRSRNQSGIYYSNSKAWLIGNSVIKKRFFFPQYQSCIFHPLHVAAILIHFLFIFLAQLTKYLFMFYRNVHNRHSSISASSSPTAFVNNNITHILYLWQQQTHSSDCA